MVTLKEIAQHCDVSITTVSNILNGKQKKVSDETRRRVLNAMEELGYHPNYFAQGLRRQKTQTVGIIAEDVAQFTTPDIIEGIMEYCETKRYRVLLQNLRLYARWKDQWYDNEKLVKTVFEPAAKELLSIKVDGIIYVAGHARKIHYFPGNIEVPAVLAYCHSDKNVSSVEVDDEQGGYAMTKYILDQGHTRIGVISGRADNIHASKRLLGYQKALFDSGILYNPNWIQYGDWEPDKAYALTKELLASGVSAIFCMSDWMAGAAYNCINDCGLKVGQDISVVGFDNERAAKWYVPKLTSCRLPLREIGNEAAKILLEHIEGQEDAQEEQRPVHLNIPCEPVIRNSVRRVEGEQKESRRTIAGE